MSAWYAVKFFAGHSSGSMYVSWCSGIFNRGCRTMSSIRRRSSGERSRRPGPGEGAVIQAESAGVKMLRLFERAREDEDEEEVEVKWRESCAQVE